VLDEAFRSEKYKFLPLFYTKDFEKPSEAKLVIIIPGGVSQKRRDYKRIFSKIKEIEKSAKEGSVPEKLIEFVFLGKAKGSELKEITDLERSLEYVTIQYFPERFLRKILKSGCRKLMFYGVRFSRKQNFSAITKSTEQLK
jgi:hypothetical protein